MAAISSCVRSLSAGNHVRAAAAHLCSMRLCRATSLLEMAVCPCRDRASFPVSGSYDFTGRGGRTSDREGNWSSPSV